VQSLVVLISGGGSNLRAILEASERLGFPARVAAVGADTDAPGLAYARERGLPEFIVSPGDFADRAAWGAALAQRVREHAPDLVVCAGFMRILPPAFVAEFSPRLLNTHPALLPAYPGAHAVRDALAAGATVTGVTVHLIDEGVDSGPIVAQRSVPVLPADTEAVLHERIKAVERELLVSVIADIASGRIDPEEVAAS